MCLLALTGLCFQQLKVIAQGPFEALSSGHKGDINCFALNQHLQNHLEVLTQTFQPHWHAAQQQYQKLTVRRPQTHMAFIMNSCYAPLCGKLQTAAEPVEARKEPSHNVKLVEYTSATCKIRPGEEITSHDPLFAILV